MTTRLSEYRNAKFRSCSTMTTVRLWSRLRPCTSSNTSMECDKSRYVVGSSRNKISVFWANTMEIHTRCLWPPDRESMVRSARSSTCVRRSASYTCSSSSEDHCLNHAWCGWRPRATRSDTRSPSGAIGDCGSIPNSRARSRRRIACTSRPSRCTDPACSGNK